MKVISIYELLGLIKDGKAPKKIKIDGYILEITDDRTNWKTLYIDGYNDYLFIDYHITLNDEIEILDSEPEFEDIEEIPNETINCASFTSADELLGNKINDLIKNQKKIINKLKEEGK